MKIAIHHHQNQGNFSNEWIAYCKEMKIDHKIVNCFDNNIFDQIEDCDALMWHHHLAHGGDYLFAKQLLYSVQSSGKKVFPDFNTNWHFDDKVGQKYLFESINAPLVPTYVFYSKGEALKWIDKTSFPKVFKLRNGAASTNVKLVKTKNDAKKLINKAFGKGFSHQQSPKDYFKEVWRKYRMGKKNLSHVRGALKRFVFVPSLDKKSNIERNYIYFQDFIPNNNFDIRLIIIEEKAFAIKRITRENDFRASGSGNLHYEKANFDEQMIKVGFEITDKLKTQSAALDFIFDNGYPKVVEISYCFPGKNFIEGCIGYWDKNLIWHEGPFNPYGWMVDTIMK